MTSMQIVSLGALAAVVAWNYAPHLKWPVIKPKAPDTLKHIEQVLSIRASYPAPEVTTACTQLLQALLQTKP